MPSTTIPAHQLLALLRHSTKHHATSHGRQLHAHILKAGLRQSPPFPVALLDMYGKSGLLQNALLLFDETPRRDPVLWSSLLSAHVHSSLPHLALSLVHPMIHVDNVVPDGYILATLVTACAALRMTLLGRQVHSQALSSGSFDDDVVKSALVDMYCKCGMVSDARKVFDMVCSRNSICWTAMVSGYASNGRLLEAVEIFQKMPKKELVTWTAMISGFVRSGNNVAAVRLFVEMHREGVRMDDYFVLPSVVGAAANIAGLEMGRQLHGMVIRLGYESSLFTGNSLVDMYAKCSDIVSARSVFKSIAVRDTVSWTTMIVGEAQHGQAEDALALFEKMIVDGMRPNEVTFVGLLYACSHVGLVSEGRQLLDSMTKYYGIIPSLHHYTCMLDLLSRSGLLSEAEDFCKTLPIEPDEAMWTALLSSCKRFGDVERTIRIADNLLRLEPKDPSTCILLSNAYAISGRWDNVDKIRNVMAGMEVRKEAGYSWVQAGKHSYLFRAGEVPLDMRDVMLRLLDELMWK